MIEHLKRGWRRLSEYRQRRAQVWPVPDPNEALLREAAWGIYQARLRREAQQAYWEQVWLHGSGGAYACVNGDAALFMGPAEYEALDYLIKEGPPATRHARPFHPENLNRKDTP